MLEILRKNIIAIVVVVLVVVVFLSLQSENSSLQQELSKLRGEVSDQYEFFYNDLDSKIDNWDNRIAKLKEAGYVETDDFSDVAKKIIASTVLVISAKDKVGLTKAGSAFIFKEEDFENGLLGTGFFVSEDGHIATARHVVEAIGQDNIIIKDSEGRSFRADLVSESKRADIAILKIDSGNRDFVDLGYYNNFDVGQEVGFVGFYFSGGEALPLVHRGVVSSKGIDDNGAEIFTVNAFVNKGNSGGPVFSVNSGRVLGVLSARKRDVSSDRFISLPPNYRSGLQLGNIDPLKLNIQLYNETLKIVGDVSQVGIGVAYPVDAIRELIGIVDITL